MRPHSPAVPARLCPRALTFLACLLFAGLAGAVPAETAGAPSPLPGEAAAAGAGDLRSSAMAAYEKDAYAEALPQLKEVHALNPQDAEVAGRLGFAAKETGAYEVALSALESAVQLKGDEYYYWWWLSDTQRLLGKYAEALKSMERARDLAPAEAREELQQYVAYTTILADGTASWENFDQHLKFSERHRNMRRVRRQIEEYVNALDVVPEYAPDEAPALARLAWVYQQIGIQYVYLEDPDPAIDYLKQALIYGRQAGALPEVMRMEQFIAIAFRLKADREPQAAAAHFEQAVKHWNNALDLARQTADLVYQRYVQGRLLETLCQFRPLDDAALVELRKANLKEVPWQGPVNEYSVAEAVLGEAVCRLFEGDYAGARILFEMGLPYFEQSKYLSDNQRVVEIYLGLARVYFQQEHYAESLDAAIKAGDAAGKARQFVDADAFNRGAGEHMLRHVAAARARACIALERPEDAFTLLEDFSVQGVRNLLASVLADDTARTDAASEQSVLKRRVPMLEGLLAKAREAADPEETARLELRLAEDTARLHWLDKGVSYLSQATLNFALPSAATLTQAREALGNDALLLYYLFDRWGGVALAVDLDAVSGFLLSPGEKEIHAGAASLQYAAGPEAVQAATAALRDGLLAPMAGLAPGKVRVVVPDPALSGLSLESLGAAEPFLYANSAASLRKAAETAVTPATRLRYVMGRAGMDPAPCAGMPPYEAVQCLDGEKAVVTGIVSDVQKNEALHLGCVLDQRPPDALLCEMTFVGDGSGDTTLPFARILGMNLPAALVILDWTAAAPGPGGLRSDAAKLITELLIYAGTRSVLVVAPGIDEEARNCFFKAFHANVTPAGATRAATLGREAVEQHWPGGNRAAGFHLYGAAH